MINHLTGLRVIEEGALRVAPLLGLADVVSSNGWNLPDIVVAAGLPADVLSHPENTISVFDADRLLTLAARRLDCPHVGLLVGKDTGLGTLGRIGRVAGGARDAGAALRGILVALHLHDRTTVPSLKVQGAVATLSTVSLSQGGEGAAIVADLTMMACFNIVRELCGPAWKPRQVRLARRRPAGTGPYLKAFGQRPVFDAGFNALEFDAAWLRAPLPADRRRSAEPFDHRAVARSLDPASQVRRACVTALIEGDPSVARLAVLLNSSRRTLNRRLAFLGTTARAQLGTARTLIAQQLLAATTLSITHIAGLLGYSDGGAFTRAFSRSAGISPSEWRRQRSSNG